MIDKPAQDEVDAMVDLPGMAAQAELLRLHAVEDARRNRNPNAPPFREKNVLCLSGGGSYGAFSAGVLCGWSARGTRPEFDVVTGISTGALLAPYAFLGSEYDERMKTFYTTLETRDIYKTRYVRGLWGESFADNGPLAEKVDEVLTPDLVCAIAREHMRGRRLYVGTTAAETKRFVVWDLGAIACKGRPQDRELIKQVLLASSAIPGFFPPQHITVDLDGRCLTERHVDGSVSQSLFLHAPYVPPEYRSKNPNHDLAGVNVYCVVAGKLYADPQPVRRTALDIAGQQISAVLYAQTRGDLQRIYTATILNGMNFYMTAIPTECPIPSSSTDFKIPELIGMFRQGYDMACRDQLWRRTPPGVAPGENANERTGVCLTYEQRGPQSPPPKSGRGVPLYPMNQQGFPVAPPVKQ
jgi:predicted acylesterase/phospholipase RssA